MKCAVVQCQPCAADIARNVAAHCEWIDRIGQQADLIVFPELSLTGYEPTLAAALAVTTSHECFDDLLQLSRRYEVTVAVGAPLRTEAGVNIAFVFLSADGTKRVCAKQYLHADEQPYFVPGPGVAPLAFGAELVAPAICYEISKAQHIADALEAGATMYVASVAKSASGVAEARARLSYVAATHRIPVMMSNCLGISDNTRCAGGSAVWNRHGSCIATLDSEREGALLLDTETDNVLAHTS